MVVLYSRPGCGLCDEAREALHRIQRRLDFELVDVNIDEDAAAHDRFFLEIPVVEHRGEVIARAPLTEATLRAAIEDALGR